MKSKWTVAIIIIVILCCVGVLCWKVVMFQRGEDFSVFSGLGGEIAPTVTPQAAVTPLTVTPVLTVSVTPAPVLVEEVLKTENAELIGLFDGMDVTVFDGEVPEFIYVIDDTIGIEKENDELSVAEFFAKDSNGAWYSFSYEKESGKIKVVNCDEERSEFVEDKTRTKLCLTWVTLNNTESYDSKIFSESGQVLLENLQKILFDGEYYEAYKLMDHERAAAYLREDSTYAEFVWYADNLRTIMNERISDEFVANLLGCDNRGDYVHVGVQVGNYNFETEEYRKVTDIWCTVFLPKEDSEEYGFWLFGPGVLEQIIEQME